MSGDGLSSDAIICAHKRLVSESTITKFLFRIEPARKYNNADKQLKERRSSSVLRERKIEDRLREAEIEEKLYQEHMKNILGTPIHYGQSVLLKHIYSGKYICLHPNSLARQVGSVKVGFVDVDSELCSMKILPSSRIKKIGDLVSYSDAIVISNSKEDHYFLHASEFLNYFDKGLEINGSETKTEWRPKLYVSDQHDNCLVSKSSIVAPGVVVLIQNKHISGYLAASPLTISQLTIKRQMLTIGGIASQQLNMWPMDLNCLKPLTGVELTVNVEITNQPSFYAMWEIQKIRLFDSVPVQYYKEAIDKSVSAVRIKNVATQQYLAIDPNDDSKLVLTIHGHLDECIFYFDSKSEGSHHTQVSTEELLRIRSHKGKFVFPSKTNSSKSSGKWQTQRLAANKTLGAVSADSDIEFEFKLSDKVDSNSSTFELVSKPKEITKVLNQLSSIFVNLSDFYQYLLYWGIKGPLPPKPEDKDGTFKDPIRGSLRFDYDTAFESEKELEIEVRAVSKNMEMIYQYLSSEISVRGNLTKYSEMRSVKSSLLEEEFITYDTKKKLLIDLNIIEMLFKICELIFFKTRESLSYFKLESGSGGAGVFPAVDKGSSKKAMLSLSQLKLLDGEMVEGLPQLIARHRLDSLLVMIFKIMYLTVWDNEHCSNYLALKFGFFQKIIEFFPKEAMDVMKEVAKNITNQEDEYINFYQPWIEMLEDISEKQGNIKKQIFILNTLSALIVDEAINEPIEEFQTKIFNHLFKSPVTKACQLLFATSSSSGVPEDDENYFQVIFKSASSRFKSEPRPRREFQRAEPVAAQLHSDKHAPRKHEGRR